MPDEKIMVNTVTISADEYYKLREQSSLSNLLENEYRNAMQTLSFYESRFGSLEDRYNRMRDEINALRTEIILSKNKAV